MKKVTSLNKAARRRARLAAVAAEHAVVEAKRLAALQAIEPAKLTVPATTLVALAAPCKPARPIHPAGNPYAWLGNGGREAWLPGNPSKKGALVKARLIHGTKPARGETFATVPTDPRSLSVQRVTRAWTGTLAKPAPAPRLRPAITPAPTHHVPHDAHVEAFYLALARYAHRLAVLRSR